MSGCGHRSRRARNVVMSVLIIHYVIR
jgi:hypothetical protein